MPKLNELFEKVANDEDLQAKYVEIIQDSLNSGEAAAYKKLIGFAKDAGFDITIDEMKEYFKEAAASKVQELTDPELDKAAGGSIAIGSGSLITVTGIPLTVAGSLVIGTSIYPGPGRSIKEIQEMLESLFK